MLSLDGGPLPMMEDRSSSSPSSGSDPEPSESLTLRFFFGRFLFLADRAASESYIDRSHRSAVFSSRPFDLNTPRRAWRNGGEKIQSLMSSRVRGASRRVGRRVLTLALRWHFTPAFVGILTWYDSKKAWEKVNWA